MMRLRSLTQHPARISSQQVLVLRLLLAGYIAWGPYSWKHAWSPFPQVLRARLNVVESFVVEWRWNWRRRCGVVVGFKSKPCLFLLLMVSLRFKSWWYLWEAVGVVVFVTGMSKVCCGVVPLVATTGPA